MVVAEVAACINLKARKKRHKSAAHNLAQEELTDVTIVPFL